MFVDIAPLDVFAMSQQINHIRTVGLISGIVVNSPVQISQSFTCRIMPTMRCTWLETLFCVIRDKQSQPTGSTVFERGPNRLDKLFSRSHVANRVVDEYDVKHAIQPKASHIAFDVFAFRIEPPTDSQHLSREIDQGHFKVVFEVKGIVTAPRSELEHSSRGTM